MNHLNLSKRHILLHRYIFSFGIFLTIAGKLKAKRNKFTTTKKLVHNENHKIRVNK